MAATTGLSDSRSLPNVCWPCREFDRGDRVCAAGSSMLCVAPAEGTRSPAPDGRIARTSSSASRRSMASETRLLARRDRVHPMRAVDLDVADAVLDGDVGGCRKRRVRRRRSLRRCRRSSSPWRRSPRRLSSPAASRAVVGRLVSRASRPSPREGRRSLARRRRVRRPRLAIRSLSARRSLRNRRESVRRASRYRIDRGRVGIRRRCRRSSGVLVSHHREQAFADIGVDRVRGDLPRRRSRSRRTPGRSSSGSSPASTFSTSSGQGRYASPSTSCIYSRTSTR